MEDDIFITGSIISSSDLIVDEKSVKSITNAHNVFETFYISDNEKLVYDDKGICSVITTRTAKNGMPKDSAPVMIGRSVKVEKLWISTEDGEEFLELAVFDGQELSYFIVPAASLLQPGSYRHELTPLRKKGISMNDTITSVKYTMGKILYSQYLLLDRSNITYFSKTAGWHTPKLSDGQLGDRFHILYGHDARFNNINKSEILYKCAGDEAIYVQTMKDLVIENPALCFWMGAAASSFLRGFGTIGSKDSDIFHAFGETSKGKTLMLQAVTSMISQGNPVLNSWNLSESGVMGRLRSFNHCFLALDEIQNYEVKKGQRPDPHDYKKIMMTLASQQSSQRARQDGSVREQHEWSVNFISTGNLSISALIEGDSQETAVDTRIWEVDVVKNPIWSFQSESKAADLETFFGEHYGFLYEKLIAEVKLNHDFYIDLYKNLNEASQAEALNYGITDSNANGAYRKLRRLSLGFTGFVLVAKVLGIFESFDDIFDANNSFSKAFVDLLTAYRKDYFETLATSENVEVKKEDVYYELVSLSESIKKHLEIAGEKESVNRMRSGQCYGRIQYDDDGDMLGLVLTSHAFDAIKKEEFLKLFAKAETLGFTKSDAGRKTKKVAKLGNCYFFDFRGKFVKTPGQVPTFAPTEVPEKPEMPF